MTPDERASGKVISDVEMINRAAEKADLYHKLGTRTYDVVSNFFDTGNIKAFKENGIDNDTIRLMQNLRESFAKQRHGVTGAVFTQQETDYYSKIWASGESSPEALRGALTNLHTQNLINRDKMEYVKRYGKDSYNSDDGIARIKDKRLENQLSKPQSAQVQFIS